MPEVELANKPSFGQYDEEANLIRTSTWEALTAEEHTFFRSLAGTGSTDDNARHVFESYVQQWTLVHELAHWWQACRKANVHRTLYQIELDANRITLAYWRAVDPQIVAVMSPIFGQILANIPSPVAPHQSVAAYFNQNDAPLHLSATPAYRWFPSQMGVALEAESPAPALSAVLRSEQ